MEMKSHDNSFSLGLEILTYFKISSFITTFNPLRQVKVRGGSVCGLSQIGDSCKGDSGSGLVYENPRTRNYEIVGIVSYGAGCNSTFNGDAIKLSEPRKFQ